MNSQCIYTFKHSDKGVGRGNIPPQIQDFGPSYVGGAGVSVYDFDWKVLSEEKPNVDGFQLHKGSKRTDFLSTVMFPEPLLGIVSEKVKGIFDSHNLPNHRFYPAIVDHKGEVLQNYYALHLVAPNSYLNLDNLQQDAINRALKTLISSMNSDDPQSKQISSRYPGAVDYLKVIFGELDLFVVPDMWRRVWGPFVSHNLYESMINADCTGIDWSEPLELR